MASAGTVAVLLPGAYYLRETQLPPVAALREAGVPIALATDHNPGSSPTLSPLLMMNMACTLFRMTPEEVARVHRQRGAGTGLTAHVRRAGRWCARRLCRGTREHPRPGLSLRSSSIATTDSGGQRVAID